MYRTGTPEGAHEKSVCEEYAAKIRAEGWTAVKTVDADSLYERYDPQFKLPGHQPLSRALVPEDFRLADRMTANMRAAFGDQFDIAVHCHWACSLRDARRLAEVIAPYRPIWLEDPLPPAWSPAWRILTEHSPVPICMGENLYSRHEFRPFIEEHGTDVVHVDVPKSGGLLEAKRIADHADLHYLSTSFHNAGSVVATVASAHVAASIREFGMIERAGYDLPWWEDLVEHDRPIIEGGYIRVPDGPGLGVRLNEDVARSHLAPGETWWE